MTPNKYYWKSSFDRGGDPQVVGEALDALGHKNGDRLVASAVVDAARPPDSVLHRYFEWDDVRAAELHRESQARLVIRSLVVVNDDTGVEMPSFIAVVEQVGGEEQRAYVSSARVLATPELTAQVLERAHDDMEKWRERYGHFRQLAKIADQAQLELRSLMESAEASAGA